MELQLSTPALLFSAITLLMLAFTNRFLAIATLIRGLHKNYLKEPDQEGAGTDMATQDPLRLGVVAGDGIGPEIVSAAVQISERALAAVSVPVEWRRLRMGLLVTLRTVTATAASSPGRREATARASRSRCSRGRCSSRSP